MKFNKFIVLISIIFLIFLTVGMVTANENITTNDELSIEENSGEYEHLNEEYDALNIEHNLKKNLDESAKLNKNDNSQYNQISVEEKSDNISNSQENYNAKIIVKNAIQHYNDNNQLVIKIVDENNKPINGANINFNEFLNLDDTKNGKYYFSHSLYTGNYNLKFTLNSNHYKAKTVYMNLKIIKSKFNGKINCKSYWGTEKSSVKMTAKAYNKYWEYNENGYFTFKVNGKSYKVKTKNGVATKTIKIKKPGTYTYYAKFTNRNYYSSPIGKGKLYVYSISKKARTFKIKGYHVVVPIKKYKKLINAKNINKAVTFEIKSNKYLKQKVAKAQRVYKWKYMGKVHPTTAHRYGWKVTNIVKHWISDGEYYATCSAYKKVAVTKLTYMNVKARVSIIIAYGGKTGNIYGFPNKYSLYLTTPYQNPGYESCEPGINGYKISSQINKLNKAKTRQP